ncbi:carbonic anhydrase [Pseudoroseomonas globiformis]|uniref:Carbonic anhydrase n=1 Tax=Teichococcus globiformis TaxID=2307229 RepID=A0ABV7G575_9PROT
MKPPPSQGLEDLLEGYHRFRAEIWPERRKLFETLARDGQAPRALVIACSDSRVDPGMVFNAAPGELFIVRNVANLVPPYKPDGDYHGTSAAIEFAVSVLEVPRIIVLGHAMCGGVKALLSGFPAGTKDFVEPWMTGIAAEARRRTLACAAVDAEEAQAQCELETVKLSLRNLLTFPFISERIASGSLSVYGGSFDIRTGIWSRLVDGKFLPMA